MNAAPIVDAHQQDEAREGPGSRLRQARLSKGLEMSRVAAQLHLSDAMVEALESDDYKSLPGPVFVRGYLKNYTRLLGIEAQDILDDFERLVPADGGGSPLVQGPNIKADVESSHVLVRIVTWLIVLLLIGLVVVWWQGRLSWPSQDDESAQTSTMEAASPGKTVAPALPETLPEHAQDEEVQAMAPAEQPETDRPQPAAAPLAAPEPTVDEEALPENVGISSGVAAERSSLERPGDETTTPMIDSAEPAPAAEPQPPARQADLAFSFADASWVDIRDASGAKKITGVMPQGARRELSGEPPFSVVLGNARVVDMWVNGEPYDVGRHIRGDVARVKVDPDNP